MTPLYETKKRKLENYLKKDPTEFKTLFQILEDGIFVRLASSLFSRSGEPAFKISKSFDCYKEFIGRSKSFDLTQDVNWVILQQKTLLLPYPFQKNHT